MSDLLVPLLVIGAMIGIIYKALGGASFRSAAGRGFKRAWRPFYDREYLSGSWLCAIALWSLADVVSDSALVFVLALVLAFLYPARKELVGAAVGLIGSVSVALSRLHDDCRVYSDVDQVAFWGGAALTVVVLLVFRVALYPLIRPVRAAVSVTAGVLGSWTTPGRPRGGASILLGTFGVLELLDLATRPGLLQVPSDWGPASISAAVALVACVAGLFAGLTILPTFTISVLSLGVAVASFLIDGGALAWTTFSGLPAPACVDWPLRVGVLIAFLLAAKVGARLVRP